MTPKTRPAAAGAAATLAACLGSCLILACSPAGPAAAQEPARGAAMAGPADAAAHVQPVAEREEDPVCSRARRRLWIEGEGWVVRRITTCR